MQVEQITVADEKMQKTLAVLVKELASIRAGRANPQLLDRVMVDYYGTPTPIHQLGNISAPEPRLLVISLWEPNMMSEVEKAIMKSDIGIMPSNDGKLIRLAIPQLTEERRKDLGKLVKKHGEEAKVAIRAIRRDLMDLFHKMKKDNELTEDDVKDYEKILQKVTDDHIKDVDKFVEQKEKEILEV